MIRPLSERKSRRFSRETPPPVERRVRITQAALIPDKQGREFVTFAVDVRFGDWHGDDIVGCAYRVSGNVYVKFGDAYYPASRLLGKNVKPIAGACQPAPPPPAQS